MPKVTQQVEMPGPPPHLPDPGTGLAVAPRGRRGDPQGKAGPWPHKGPERGRGRTGSQLGSRSWQVPGSLSSGVECVGKGLCAGVPGPRGADRQAPAPAASLLPQPPHEAGTVVIPISQRQKPSLRGWACQAPAIARAASCLTPTGPDQERAGVPRPGPSQNQVGRQGPAHKSTTEAQRPALP